MLRHLESFLCETVLIRLPGAVLAGQDDDPRYVGGICFRRWEHAGTCTYLNPRAARVALKRAPPSARQPGSIPDIVVRVIEALSPLAQKFMTGHSAPDPLHALLGMLDSLGRASASRARVLIVPPAAGLTTWFHRVELWVALRRPPARALLSGVRIWCTITTARAHTVARWVHARVVVTIPGARHLPMISRPAVFARDLITVVYKPGQ